MNARDKNFDPSTLERDYCGRIAAVDWSQIGADLDAQGAALIERLITPAECRALAALYPRDEPFRSRVLMARHGFGRGEYKYFRYPLSELIVSLREAIYRHLGLLGESRLDQEHHRVGFCHCVTGAIVMHRQSRDHEHALIFFDTQAAACVDDYCV